MKSGKLAFIETGGDSKYPREPAGLGPSDPAWAQEQEGDYEEEAQYEEEQGQEENRQSSPNPNADSERIQPEARNGNGQNYSRPSNTSRTRILAPRFYNYHQGEDVNSQGHRQILLKVFQTYTSFGERTNLKHLRSNKLHKMMADSGIPLDKTTVDLLFVSENKHK